MQKDRAHRAPPRGFFIFVRPAAFVSERAAAGKIRLCFSRRRIINEHHQNLPAIILRRSFVVIPFLFGRIDAVTDEDKLSINLDVFGLGAGESHKIIGEVERLAANALS